MNVLKVIVVLLAVTFSLQSHARIDAFPFEDPAQEAVYAKLIKELRCLVCQNQNLAGSNAELAMDLRRKTYEMAIQGKTEEEIVEYMTERYGDFVMYRPPMKKKTYFLWLGPFAILFLGLFLLIKVIRGRSQTIETTVLSDEEKNQAADLLKSK